MSRFDAIPVEIAINILRYVEAPDILSLQSICRYFNQLLKDDYVWRKLLLFKVKKQEIDALDCTLFPTYRDKYLELSRYRNFAADTDTVKISWSEHPIYWRFLDTKSSSYRKIASLTAILTLQISTNIQVPNGIWDVVWRIKVTGDPELNPTCLEGTKFSAVVPTDENSPVSHPSRSKFVSVKSIRLHQPITVSSPNGTNIVTVSLKNCKSTLKRGLEIDYIELVKYRGCGQDGCDGRDGRDEGCGCGVRETTERRGRIKAVKKRLKGVWKKLKWWERGVGKMRLL
ncbi:hypothetical protein BKA69DRAFT_272319 [Paraphysoderma sedebokerense]|nr:hypothetical protein BKA69DRAFT_272319 [Paraphysoderma sedebokerense]